MATFDGDDLKILRISGPIILKGLDARMKMCLDRMYGAFRSGKTEFIADIAEFATIREQINEINNALNKEG